MARRQQLTSSGIRTRYERGERDFRGTAFVGSAFDNLRLRNCDFSGAQLRQVSFKSSTFDSCRFSVVDMGRVTFTACQLTRCDLSYAKAEHLYLEASTITECVLDKMLATNSVFNAARISDTRCFNIRLDGSSFVACDVTASSFDYAVMQQVSFIATNLICWAESSGVWFGSGANVDWRSVSLSLRTPLLTNLLLASGMPSVFVHYMMDCARALDPHAVFKLMRSTFISYGGPDADFARRLRDDLQRAGVRTFLFEDDARPGEKLHNVMRDGVNRFERIVLVCSRESLDRSGVQNEIEQALARESREGGAAYLIPVTLDDYVFSWSPKRPHLAQEIRDRVVADFRGTQDDLRRYARAVQKLISALAE